MTYNDLWQRLDDRLWQTVSQLYPTLEATLVTQVFFTPPKDNSHGDLACHVAMLLAKPLKLAPKHIAEQLAAALTHWPEVAQVDIAGPGFINLHLSDQALIDQTAQILAYPASYGHADLGAGQSVNVEYVSVNPTGPLHVGHARGAVLGDALSALLMRIGFAVTREYYVNDAGVQVDALARSLYKRYLEVIGAGAQQIEAPLYPGEYLIPVAERLAAQEGQVLRDQPESVWLPKVRDFAIAAMMDIIRADLARLGVQHEIFSSERALVEAGAVEQSLALLEQKDLLYRGVLEPPKGKPSEDWEPREQLLFKSSQFGDDCDRPLIKSDGTYSYFTPDITYHHDKVERGFHWLINVFGADHIGYVKRLKAAVAAFSNVRFDVLCVQLVRFMDRGEPVRMSKRTGAFVSLEELVSRVGKDVARLHLLGRKNDAHMDFDLEQMAEQSLDNPVFYIHYAHARCHSAIQHAKEIFSAHDLGLMEEMMVNASAGWEFSGGISLERRLMLKLMEYPMLLRRAGLSLEVHRLVLYLRELAKELHAYWNLGRDQTELRVVLRDDLAVTRARVQLMWAVKHVLADGLSLLGVEARDELR